MPGNEELVRVVAEAVADRSVVVRVDRGGVRELEWASGFADRANRIANSPATRLAMASGSKGFTAVVVMSLVVDGTLSLDTPARSLLGDDLSLVDDAVTVEHLLAHRSGIGDYLDEDVDLDITDYLLRVPVHTLTSTEAFVPAIDGFPQQFPPGERFSYCNGGYVVLAILAERAAGVRFEELVRRRLCDPAGMADTAFLRSDELPGGAALGYLPIAGHDRTNVFHLPVLGSGDGGCFTTVADMARFWTALDRGAIVPTDAVAEMVRPRSDTGQSLAYGLGFWIDEPRGVVRLEGYDAGASFRSIHQPASATTCTVISNTSDDTWPVVKALAAALDLA